MWIASVTNVTRQPEVILVEITYTNDTDSIKETHKLYNKPGNPDEWLRKTAQGKLDRLNALDTTDIPTGPIGPWTDPADPELTAFERALRKLGRIKLLVDTKVLLETDARIAAFIQNLRSKVDDYWDEL